MNFRFIKCKNFLYKKISRKKSFSDFYYNFVKGRKDESVSKHKIPQDDAADLAVVVSWKNLTLKQLELS